MSGWGKTTDASAAGNVDLGANNTPFRYKGGSSPEAATQAAEKRNVIMTDQGYVRRLNTVDLNANQRTRDEILIAQAGVPGDAGFPNITEIYLSSNASGGVLSAAGAGNVYVVFSEPVNFNLNATDLTLSIANTAGGNHAVARCEVGDALLNANNTLVFKFTSGERGTYQVNAQSIGVSGSFQNLISLNTSGATANIVISGAVSNNLSTFSA